MKPEPLRNKGKRIVLDCSLYFQDKDIKSAVEWLEQKEYVLGYGKCTKCGNYHTYREHIVHKDREEDEFICFTCNLKEAFEDVTKSSHKEK